MFYIRYVFILVMAQLFVYTGGAILAETADRMPCYGWDCEVVKCPDGYAVQLPNGKFLPCEKFDEYVETENEGVLID